MYINEPAVRHSMAQHGTVPHSTAPHGRARAATGTGHGPARHCTALRRWAGAAVRSAERGRADDDAPSPGCAVHCAMCLLAMSFSDRQCGCNFLGRSGGGWRTHLLVCLCHLAIDHASLSRRSTVPTPNRDNSNIWALLTLLPYTT